MTQSSDTRVALSLLSVTLSPDVSYPWSAIAGIPVAWTTSVTDDKGQAANKPVTLHLYAANDNASLWACVTGSSAQCSSTLPTSDKFTMVATVVDEEGVTVRAEYELGKSQEEWSKGPLDTLGAVSFNLDKSSYAVGDTATLSFTSYFTQATLLLYHAGVFSQHSVTEGKNRLSMAVGDPCQGGCNVYAMLSIPKQSAALSDRFKGIPTSTGLDVLAPRFFDASLSLVVPDVLRSIDVVVTPSKSKAEPGQSVTLTVTLSDPKTNAPVTGEVAIFVVDQAFLDVEPHPLLALNDSFMLNAQSNSLQRSGVLCTCTVSKTHTHAHTQRPQGTTGRAWATGNGWRPTSRPTRDGWPRTPGSPPPGTAGPQGSRTSRTNPTWMDSRAA